MIIYLSIVLFMTFWKLESSFGGLYKNKRLGKGKLWVGRIMTQVLWNKYGDRICIIKKHLKYTYSQMAREKNATGTLKRNVFGWFYFLLKNWLDRITGFLLYNLRRKLLENLFPSLVIKYTVFSFLFFCFLLCD